MQVLDRLQRKASPEELRRRAHELFSAGLYKEAQRLFERTGETVEPQRLGGIAALPCTKHEARCSWRV